MQACLVLPLRISAWSPILELSIVVACCTSMHVHWLLHQLVGLAHLLVTQQVWLFACMSDW
jgi:hypothetical protein